ncbi:hypothetical protein Ancab_014797 [Ancistrocladus abbreviatus]
MDSLSRIPCTPEEMYSARLEKEVHRSGDIHATLREGGPKLAKISSESFRLRQDKKKHTEAVCDQRVQWFSQEKAENREKVRVSSCSGEQAFQTKDGHSGETPSRFQIQNQNKPKKNSIKKQSLSLQQSDREGKEYRDRYVGPILVGPSNIEEETTSAQGALAQISHDISAQEELAPRENKSRSQQLSQIGLFTLPRNRKKTPYVDRGAANAIGMPLDMDVFIPEEYVIKRRMERKVAMEAVVGSSSERMMRSERHVKEMRKQGPSKVGLDQYEYAMSKGFVTIDNFIYICMSA